MKGVKKFNIPEDMECSLVAIGGIMMDDKGGAGNLASFTPPEDANLWRLEFKTGDVGITDGKVLVVYGKVEKKANGRDKGKLINIAGKSRG